jgi:hypothetical protein
MSTNFKGRAKMTIKVIVQPVGSEAPDRDYHKTLVEPRPTKSILGKVPSKDRERLRASFKGHTLIRVWGVVRGGRGVNATRWKRVEPGDVVLFTSDNRIVATSKVVDKVRSGALAKHLKWEPENWEYIYFVEKLKARNIAISTFNRMVGFKREYVSRGFNVLDQEKSDRLLDGLKLETSRFRSPISEDEYRKVVRRINKPSAGDRQVLARVRKEQAYLRGRLFGKETESTCCMCGTTLPVALLVAAHIKKRAKCTKAEMNDSSNIVASMCVLGCDALYERGFVSVSERGRIVRTIGAPSTKASRRAVARICQKSCSDWRPETASYFQYHHRAAHF